MASDYGDWCRSIGVAASESLTLTEFDGERGVAAATAIEAGELLVSVPFETMLTTASLVGTPLEPLLSDAELNVCEDDLLAILLLEERAKGAASRWAPHIAALPPRYDNVLYFSDADVERLHGSNLHVTARQLREQVATDHVKLFPKLLRKYGKVLTLVSKDCSRDAYQWALSSVYSRCCSVTRKGKLHKAMCCFFDMFNHDPYSTSQHSFVDAADALELRVGVACPSGEQVMINYGPVGNSKFLTFYGFALADNPYDSVDVWATMSPQAPDYAIKRQVLKQAKCDDSKPFLLTAQREEDGLVSSWADGRPIERGVPSALIGCLRVQRMTDAEMSVAPLAFDEQLSESNENGVKGALASAFSDMLAAYGDSTKADLEAAATGTGRAQTIAHLRVSEKEILGACLAELTGEEPLGKID